MNKKQEKQFDNEFGEESGIYYGKDIDGDRIFIPNGALEPIKQFISTTLKAQRKKHIEIIKKKAHKDKDCGTLEEPACGVNQTLKEIIKQIK